MGQWVQLGRGVPMSGSVVRFDDLQRLCRPEGPLPRAATVRRWANAQGIRVKPDGAGGFWTTTDALNFALGLVTPANDVARLEDLI